MSSKKRAGNVSALNRLKNDYKRIKSDPIPLIHAEPDPQNLLVWHYCVIGPPDTAYEGGYFHGKLQFPSDFPFKPPSILMLTPNGRFKINQRLCLSISDFHPDTWNPAWSAGTILTGLLSFMVEEATTYGSIETPYAVRQRLARDSGSENLRNEKFCELFPDLVEEINAKLEKRRAQAKPVKKVEKEPETSSAINTTTNLRAVNNQQSDNGLSNMAIFAMITLLVLSVSAMKDETVNVEHRPLGRIGGALFCFSIFITSFYGAIFILGPCFALIYIWPWLYRRVVDRIVAFWLIFPIALLEKVFRVKFFVKGDGFNYMERTVIIMNHRTRVDWMLFWPCLFHCARLRKLKIVLKSDLKYIPGPGWAMQAAGFIFLDRKWERDRPHVEDLLHYFNDPNINEPLILLLFPEGTDLTENTKSRSDKFADKQGLPKYDYVLHPRTTGFTHLVKQLVQANAIDCIHDISVGYPAGLIRNENDLIEGKMPKEVHFSITRHPVDTLPTSNEEQMSSWLNEKWRAKEEKLKKFYTSDRQFLDTRQPYWDKRTISIWIALLFWPSFIVVCSYGLIVSQMLKWYGLGSIVFYIFALRANGGVEKLEMAVFQALHNKNLKKD